MYELMFTLSCERWRTESRGRRMAARWTPPPRAKSRRRCRRSRRRGASASSAGELAAAVGMEQSAVSHQLRILRHLGLVIGERRGRSVIYALHDSHVADLLDQAVFHIEHLRLGYPERIREAS